MTTRTAEPRVALLGDLVASRRAADRAALHERLSVALARANARHTPLDPLRVTAGDEFQGVFTTVGAALAAAWTVRLGLGDTADARVGVARGAVQVLDATSGIQDGSAWWAARAAIEEVETRAKGAHRMLRTGLAAAPDAEPIPLELRAAVELADTVLATLDETGRVILAALMAGHTQAEAAVGLGISRSAVSQRIARSGIAILADALTRLEEVR